MHALLLFSSMKKLVLDDLHALVNYALNLPRPLKSDRHLVYLEEGEFIFLLSDRKYERWLLSPVVLLRVQH